MNWQETIYFSVKFMCMTWAFVTITLSVNNRNPWK